MLDQIIAKLCDALPIIRDIRKDNRELADNALRSISHALTETYLYYSRLARKGRDRDNEEQLARYWAAAAIPLRHIDRELAIICENKAEYWLNPESYAAEDIERYGIGLDQVRRRYRECLVPRLHPSRQV